MSKDRLQRRGLIKSDMAKKRSIKKTKEEKKRNLEEFSFFFVSVRGFVCCNENWDSRSRYKLPTNDVLLDLS